MENAPLLFDKLAEDTLLGIALMQPDTIGAVDMKPEWFYQVNAREVWTAMETVATREGLDYLTLRAELDKRGKLLEVGGDGYLTALISQMPVFENPERCAGIIRGMAQRRAMAQAANDMARAAYNLKADLSEASGQIIDRISRISAPARGAVHWSRYLADLETDVQTRMDNPKDIFGIPTGFNVFDRITGGLQQGELLLLSGKPGMGKSILAMQAARQMAMTAPGAIYSIEMTGLQVVRRESSAKSGVLSRALKTGRMNGTEQGAFIQAVNELSRLPVYMSDDTGWTTTSVRADLARLKAVHGIQWFVFDYLMLAGDAPNLDEIQRTQIISRNFKLLCRHLDLAGMVIHSMNKLGIADTKPDQASLRGSGQVIYDADLIAFLTDFQPMKPSEQWISPVDQKNLRTLFFAKGRELEDPQKYLHLVKLPTFPAFGDYAEDMR